MKYLSVCSGMEAATVAWHPLGWEPVGFSEIEPFPCAILKHRFPNTPNYGSLTEYQSWPIEPGSIDLLVGGTPCQSFSVAGLRKGMQDPRGNLALTFLGLADRLRPRWIIWENVPGVLSSNGGRDFGAFLGALGQLGYGWAYRVLDAQHFGVPQRRRRVFVVATSSGDGRLAGEVLSLPEGLRGYLEARRKKGQGVAPGPAGGVDADGRQGPWWDGRDTAHTLTKKGAGGEQRMPDKGNFGAVIQPKPVVIDREAFNQGADGKQGGTINCQPDGISGTVSCKWSKGSGGPAGDEHYNMVATPYRKARRAQSKTDHETWVEGDVSNTLNTFDLTGDTRTTHAVVEPGQVIPPLTVKMQGQAGWAPYNETAHILPVIDTTHAVVEPAPVISPTVTTCKGSRGGCSSEAIDEIEAVHKALQPIPLDLRNATRDPEKHDEQNRQGVGVGDHGDPAHTLTKEFVHGVAQPIDPKIIQASELRLQGKITEQDVCPTLKANTKSGDTEPLALQPVAFQPGNLRRQAGADPSTEVFPTVKCDAGDQAPHVVIPPLPMAVRRLTPIECERLQGFPDNWSRIPWKGKPEEECPDGPRYKACGNSMAVPVMRWIGSRIAKIEGKSK